MKICIAGASGLIGSHLVQLLTTLAEVSEIITLTRSPLLDKNPKVKNQVVDFNTLPSVTADVFISCLGTTLKVAGSKAEFKKIDHDYVLNLGKIAENSEAKKFLVVSAIGANAQSPVFYSRTKGEMERDIALLKISEIAVFRPSLLLGDRKEKRGLETIAQKATPLFNAILLGPLKKYRAISAQNVAQAMVQVALASHLGFSIYESDQIQSLSEIEAK